jgi:hypothetical protein
LCVLDEYNLREIALAQSEDKNGHGWKAVHEGIGNQTTPQIDEKITHTPVAAMINIG